MVFSGFQPDGHNEGALVRVGYHCSGLILQDHPVDATVDNAGMNAGLMVAIVLPRYLPQASNNTGVANSSTRCRSDRDGLGSTAMRPGYSR